MGYFDELSYETQIIPNGGCFGKNCEFDFKQAFKKLAKLGANIKIPDRSTAIVFFPKEKAQEILTFIIIGLPGCSSARGIKYMFDDIGLVDCLELNWNH